jgi:hypothetical protein
MNEAQPMPKQPIILAVPPNPTKQQVTRYS